MNDTDDNALKVSWMITDADGGLEVGDNAVHVEGFSDEAMMTNQQRLNFTAAGILEFDSLNFELPNLAYGAYASGDRANPAASTDGSMFDDLREALDADAIINDWAGFENRGRGSQRRLGGYFAGSVRHERPHM